MVLTCRITIPGGNETIVDGGITYPWVGSYNTGLTMDGLPYVVAPNGVMLEEPTPVSFTDAGRYKNGQMKNPERLVSNAQALDDGEATRYDPTKAAVFNDPYRPGDVLLKGLSEATLNGPLSDGRAGLLAQASALYVVAAPLASNVMAPTIWPSADAANRPWRVVDLDGFLNLLPSLSTVGHSVVTWAQIGAWLDRFDIGAALMTSDSAGGVEYLTTHRYAATTSSNYGRNVNSAVSAMMTGLMSNAWSSDDKTAAAIRVLQRGCQVGEAAVAANVRVLDGGAQFYSTYASSLAWLRATGRHDQYSTWLPLVGGNIYYQYYRITQAMIDNDFVYHTDPLKPYPYRAREVLSVTNGGLTVDVEGFIPAGGGLTGDSSSNGVLSGLNLRRNSDNEQAYLTASAQFGAGPGFWRLTLAAPIAGLTAGQMVNCVAPWALVDGDADWGPRPPDLFPNMRNPSKNSAYRNLNYHAIDHLFTHAIGMHGSAMNAARDYTIRAMAVNTPTAQDDYPSHADTLSEEVTGSTNSWMPQFWASHNVAILALPQII